MSVASTSTSSLSERRTPGALLTVPEVAAILRVTPRTVRRWANEGRIARIKIGSVARFSPEAIELLCTENESSPAGKPGSDSKLTDAGGHREAYRGE